MPYWKGIFFFADVSSRTTTLLLVMGKPLIDKKYRLEKFHGKGGWTYARLPKLPKNKKGASSWKKVKGSIDGYEIKKYHLMPYGDGSVILPVKSEIRKKIKKEEGDLVHIILYPDNDPFEIPEELLLCLEDEPSALHFFQSLSESERTFYIQWIFSAKREETKISRMAITINRLVKGKKRYDKDID